MGSEPLYTFKCLLCKKFQTFDLRQARKHLLDAKCDGLPDNQAITNIDHYLMAIHNLEVKKIKEKLAEKTSASAASKRPMTEREPSQTFECNPGDMVRII